MSRWRRRGFFKGAFRLVLLRLVPVALVGCARSTAVVRMAVRTPSGDALVKRAHARFDSAALYKPDDTLTDPLDPVMCPLIVWETDPESTERGAVSGPGFVFRGADGAWRVDETQGVVYAELESTFLGGGVRSQIVLAWCHEVALSETSVEVICRGLRMTLDRSGSVLSWEVLDPKLRGRVVYVSESVEQLSAADYGPALPGRRHSVERAVADAPETVVPRILSDGPVPMGPYVYLERTRGEVASVLCRCMPSQVEEFTDTRYYQVLPLAELDPLGWRAQLDESSLSARLRWPDGIE